MIRILVIDAHAVVREGVKRIVEETPDCCVVGEARDARTGLTHLPAHACDVVVLGLNLAEHEGLQGLQRLLQTHPTLPVVVVSRHATLPQALQAFTAGATGYLPQAYACRGIDPGPTPGGAREALRQPHADRGGRQRRDR